MSVEQLGSCDALTVFQCALLLLPAGCRKALTHRPKIRVFTPQGRLVAPIHVKLCRTDGHASPLGCVKFHLNRHRGGGNAAPKISKISIFRLDALAKALSVIATATWLGVCHSRYCIKTTKPIRKLFGPSGRHHLSI